MARTDELIEACKELALESIEWDRLQREAKEERKKLSSEELQRLTSKGAWEKYLRAGGSTTMINKQLSEEEDFGGQYKRLRDEHGKED